MLLRDILGHEQILTELRSAHQRDRVAHAYLFAGPEGIGKERVAKAYFQLLSCKDPIDGPDACGRCRPCRLLADGRHPDFIELVREGSFIKIERVREVNGIVRFPPVEARIRAVLVREADAMTEPAANALLKTLEEPSPRNVFILTSAKPNALLPTIRSRCQQLRFSVVPRPIIADWLTREHDVDPETAEEIAAMSGGSFGAAATLVDPTTAALREEWLTAIARLAGPLRPTELLQMAEDIGASRDAVPKVLDILRLGLRDVLLQSAGASEELLTFRGRTLPRVERAAALRSLELLDETEDGLRRNVNPRMLGEHLLLGLRKALREPGP